MTKLSGIRHALVAAGLLCTLMGPSNAQTETVLHTFSAQDAFGGNSDGAMPNGLVQGQDGNFYGVTNGGGIVGAQTGGDGVAFKVTGSGVFTVLHQFSATTGGSQTNTEGEFPGNLVLGPDGNFYGDCAMGGSNGGGTIYKMTPTGTISVLHTFSALDGSGHNTDGYGPSTISMVGSDGYIYGGTVEGGSNGSGTIYRMTTTGTFTALHNFAAINPTTGANTDGLSPTAPLLQDITTATAYDLYGSMLQGGTNATGTLYHLAVSGATVTFSTLHTFAALSGSTNTDGASPAAPTWNDSSGLHGVTMAGGANGYGTLYHIASDGTFTTDRSFGSTGDGISPTGLFEGTDWSLHGTTQYVGSNGGGTIFKVFNGGGSYTQSYSFTSGLTSSMGNGPDTTFEANDGNFYGGTIWGGANQTGVIYKYNAALSTGLFPLLPQPSTCLVGVPTFLMILGGGYQFPNETVTFAGTTLATSYISPQAVAVVVPASLVATAGDKSYSVQYTKPDGTASTYNGTYTVYNPAPVLTSLSPSSANAGSGTTTLTVNGTGFYTNSVVNFNGTALTTTYVSSTKLTAPIPTASLSSAANVTVDVSTTGAALSNSLTFSINPILTSLSPTGTYAGHATFTITATGVGFQSGATVNWNGTPLTTTFVSSTSLTATVPASLVASVGTASVTVACFGATSNAITFNILAASITVGNDSFETPTTTSNINDPTGASWTFTNGGSRFAGIATGSTAGGVTPPAGSQVCYVQSTSSITQALTGFVPGISYKISVDAGYRSGFPADAIDITVNGTTVGSFTPSSTAYANYSATFTATSSTETIGFVGTTSSTNETNLDVVTVQGN